MVTPKHEFPVKDKEFPVRACELCLSDILSTAGGGMATVMNMRPALEEADCMHLSVDSPSHQYYIGSKSPSTLTCNARMDVS